MAQLRFSKHATNLYQYCQELTSWNYLRRLGNSRIVTSSLIWFVLIPIAAKVIAPFDEVLSNEKLWESASGALTYCTRIVSPESEPIALEPKNISLPFSWILLFAAATAFSVGQVVYWCACPVTIKRYRDFGDYRTKHEGGYPFLDFLANRITKLRPHEFKTFVKETRSSFEIREASAAAVIEAKYESSNFECRSLFAKEITGILKDDWSSGRTSLVSDAFERFQNRVGKDGLIWRLLCCIFYGLGLGIIVHLMFINIRYVCSVAW